MQNVFVLLCCFLPYDMQIFKCRSKCIYWNIEAWFMQFFKDVWSPDIFYLPSVFETMREVFFGVISRQLCSLSSSTIYHVQMYIPQFNCPVHDTFSTGSPARKRALRYLNSDLKKKLIHIAMNNLTHYMLYSHGPRGIPFGKLCWLNLCIILTKVNK